MEEDYDDDDDYIVFHTMYSDLYGSENK